MEMRGTIRIVLAAIAALVLFLWLKPSESKRIRKVFATVSRELRKEGPEGVVVSAAKARALAELVAPGARIDLDGRTMHGVDGRQLAQSIILVRRQCDKIEVGFADIAIAFTDGTTASVTADVYVRGLSDALDISGRDAREVETLLVKDKDDGKWRFKSVRLVPVVEK